MHSSSAAAFLLLNHKQQASVTYVESLFFSGIFSVCIWTEFLNFWLKFSQSYSFEM